MKTIEYRVLYSGALERKRGAFTTMGENPSEEIVSVQARDINSGFAKALKRANEPLGNGQRREIGSVEFWRVV